MVSTGYPLVFHFRTQHAYFPSADFILYCIEAERRIKYKVWKRKRERDKIEQSTREKERDNKISHRKLSKLTLYSILHARTHKDIIKFYGSIYSFYYIIFSKSFFYLIKLLSISTIFFGYLIYFICHLFLCG